MAPTDRIVLQTLGVKLSFNERPALVDVDLSVQAGELFGLIGPDGAGKTTLIRVLVGLMAPCAGKALVFGLDPIRNRQSIRLAIGYMPQAYSLYGDLTVSENLWFFGRMFDLDKTEFAKRKKRLLGITRLEAFRHRRADALSGGMYKKLALSCALLHRPQVLLLDEPTNGVDPVSRRELWDLLSEFVAEGMAVLISTPYMDEAARCHRIGLLHTGRMLLAGDPTDLLAQSGSSSIQELFLEMTRQPVLSGKRVQRDLA
jgi:ABC-2 type transport system ATP-binding protein